jgi:hypothetical protein
MFNIFSYQENINQNNIEILFYLSHINHPKKNNKKK